MYRGRARQMALAGAQMVLRRSNGDLARSEGVRNWAHGPVRAGSHRSILSIRRNADRPRTATPATGRALYEAMTRDELRQVAKAHGLTGYGRMNKEQLIEAVLA